MAYMYLFEIHDPENANKDVFHPFPHSLGITNTNLEK